MSRHLASCLAIAALVTISPRPLSAAIGPPIVYDAVDAIDVQRDRIEVTGIISGDDGPSTTLYQILGTTTGSSANDVAAARCDRLALLAMSKPGKFQFAVTLQATFPNRHSCKLIVRTP
jgi:hypothetical protein